MTRPSTLSAVANRIASGDASSKAISEFLDSFYSCADAWQRVAMFAEEPASTGSARNDALMAAICEYLSKRYSLPRIPEWISGPGRILKDPWFTVSSDADEMREYLQFTSPAEFRSRNIFTAAVPLRRASQRKSDPDEEAAPIFRAPG